MDDNNHHHRNLKTFRVVHKKNPKNLSDEFKLQSSPGKMIGGGRVYWGKKADREMDDGGSNGVVVIFAWSSINESHLASFVDLYSSLGWNSLVCRADFLTA